MTILKYPTLIILYFLSNSANSYSDKLGNWDVEGASGRIEVRGRLVESACWLDLASAYQEIDLGVLPMAKFDRPNSKGEPVVFTINLRDCTRSITNQDDLKTSKLIDYYQPSVRISFLAPTVASNSRIISVSGVKGIGLAIKDMNNQYASIGMEGIPLTLNPGQNSLTFTITPEYYSGSLTAGSFNASILFYMKYN